MGKQWLCAILLAGTAFGEGNLAADFRREGRKLKKECSSFKSFFGCASTLFTDHPLHIAAGSLAPGNGVGAGGAFVKAWNTENLRNSLNMDAVGTMNGSWRAGGYLNIAIVRRPGIVVVDGTDPNNPSNLAVKEAPVVQIYAEATSLNTIAYFGLGPDTPDTARTYYGQRQVIAGVRGVLPLGGPLNASLEAEANGRFVELRAAPGQKSPSIETRFNDLTAPGLVSQPAFLQFGEGIRIRPYLAGGHVRLNYSVRFQHFIAGDSANSFQRFVGDFSHEIPLYGTSRVTAVQEGNGPDHCVSSGSDDSCAPLPRSRNLNGSIAFRVMMTQSYTSGASAVPFYFQPTLGGSDLNGNPTLASYQDYRFRGPNTILFRGAFEHSIWGPLGLAAMADWGKASLQRLDTDHLRHSYSAGLTLRAGAFPLVYLLFAWGGNEGTHTTTRMRTSLLGSASRPSQF